jgi:hypothetical protein
MNDEIDGINQLLPDMSPISMEGNDKTAAI